jgi:hypothetical protein
LAWDDPFPIPQVRLSALKTLPPFAGPNFVSRTGRSFSKNTGPVNDWFQGRLVPAYSAALLWIPERQVLGNIAPMPPFPKHRNANGCVEKV